MQNKYFYPSYLCFIITFSFPDEPFVSMYQLVFSGADRSLWRACVYRIVSGILFQILVVSSFFVCLLPFTLGLKVQCYCCFIPTIPVCAEPFCRLAKKNYELWHNRCLMSKLGAQLQNWSVKQRRILIKVFSHYCFLISVTNAICLHTKNNDQSNRGWMTPVQVVECPIAGEPILDCN